jgi:hypothetical protein
MRFDRIPTQPYGGDVCTRVGHTRGIITFGQYTSTAAHVCIFIANYRPRDQYTRDACVHGRVPNKSIFVQITIFSSDITTTTAMIMIMMMMMIIIIVVFTLRTYGQQ